MTPEQEQNLKETVEGIVGAAGTIATVFAPQYTAFIVLGQAIAKIAPEIYHDIVLLISKEDPTPEEIKELARKLNALANPELDL